MMWFLLLLKRNFKHFSFVLILCLLPLFTLFMRVVSEADDSIMKIGYTHTGECDKALLSVFEKIEQDDGVIKYIKFDSRKKGERNLANSEIDALWIFEGDLKNALKDFYDNKREYVVTVLNREENEVSEIALEKLFCFIYPDVAFSLFEDYMKEEIKGGEALSQEELSLYFNYKGINSSIVEIKTVDALGKESDNEVSYLLTATRGILCLLVLLSSLSAALYIKEDIERGLFALMTPLKRVGIFLMAILSALIPTGVVFFICVLISGAFEGLLKELSSLLLFLITCAFFVLAMLSLFKSKKAFCIAFPITVTVAAVFSPIFLNLQVFPALQVLFPTYHYLYSFSDPKEFLYGALYVFIALIFTLFLEMKRDVKA